MSTTLTRRTAMYFVLAVGVMLAAVPMRPAQAAPVVVQDRDEPGRSPYQEEKFGCDTTGCTLTFTKVPAGNRLVVTHVACDQFVPSGGSPYYVSLSSSVYGKPFIPLMFQYSGPYNEGAGYVYIANTEVLAYFEAGVTPFVTMYGSPPALANGHCNLSGYFIKLP